MIVRQEAWAEQAYYGADVPRAAIEEAVVLDPRDRLRGSGLIGLPERAEKEEAKP